MNRWTRVPLAPLAVAFAGGIALARWLEPSTVWVSLLAALAWGASLLVLDHQAAAAVCLLLGVAATGAIRAATPPLAPDHIARLPLPRTASIEGRLATEPVIVAPDRTRLLVEVARVDDVPRSGRLQMTIYGTELPPLTEAQRVAISARVRHAGGFRNPGTFDYGAYLERQAIHVVGTAHAEDIKPLDAPTPSWSLRVRHGARSAMNAALPPASAALLGGLLLGDRTELPREIDDKFRRAGVYHVLAVSGFNVALVAGTAWSVLTLARVGRRVAALAAIAVVLGFAVVVGPEPSVVRAVVMGVLVLGAMLLDREAAVLNSLSLAAILILAARPGDLADPGFQLSFAATAGIVLAPLPSGLVLGSLGVTLAAQIAVLPIALFHFNQLSTIAPVANVAVVPLAALATVLGLLASVMTFLTPVAAELFFNATWPVLLALRGVVALTAAVPGALLHLPAPSWAAIVAYVIGLGLAFGWWHWRTQHPMRSRRAGTAALAALGVALLLELWPVLRPADGRLRVTVLDVGQGDAIVVEAPGGQTLLVDTGPGGGRRLDAGERVVAPFLWNRGVLALSAVVVTHADQDHAGGLGAISRDFSIARTLESQSRSWVGGLAVTVLAPPLAAPALRRNDEALVVRLDWGLASFLLASDATAAAERALLGAHVPLDARILKVAHHGAAGSSTTAFLERVRPSVAVISVGARNPYGHPAAETLARLHAAGARIARTDRDGAVIVETDGRSLVVTRWASGTVERYCLDPETRCES